MTDRYTPEDAARAERAFAREVLRLQQWLNIQDDDFARIVAIREADVPRMKSGEIVITHDSRSFEIGIHFVRFCRLLCTIVHGDQNSARTWFYGPNKALGDVPLYKIQDYAGLHYVIDYLSSRSSLT